VSFEEQIMFKDKCLSIFAPNRGYCVIDPSNMFFATRAGLEIWECHSDIPQF